ncbi:MAG: NADH-quinone oxidoreductase subunit K [Anaerolineae bacterium]|nr:NADH-quinone oxidoreductase subunit K [Anaerolineae bacterium]
MVGYAWLYALGGMILFGMGLYALLAYPHLLRKILGMNVMGIGVFMLFVALAYRGIGQSPDPVPHALVITGIVVAVCATGLALSLAYRIKMATGQAVLAVDEEDTA